jgi:TRAP transporter TAXI family solute receptor
VTCFKEKEEDMIHNRLRHFQRSGGAIVFFLAMLMVSNTATATEPVNLSIASFKSGSGWYVLAQSMAQIIKQNLPPGSVVDVLPYSGGAGNPPLLHQKKATLALGYPHLTILAMQGKAPYKAPMKELRMLVGRLDTYWNLFAARKETKISSFEELKAQKFPLRLVMTPKGSTGEWMNNAVLNAYGVSFKDIESWGGKVTLTSFANAVQMVKDGHADAWGHIATPGHPSWTELSSTVDLKFFSLSDAVAKKMVAEYGFNQTAIPKGTFRGIANDLPAISWYTSVIATTDLSEDAAYKICEAICSNKAALETAYKGAKTFDPRKAWDTPVPLHAGAEKYYKDKGYK